MSKTKVWESWHLGEEVGLKIHQDSNTYLMRQILLVLVNFAALLSSPPLKL